MGVKPHSASRYQTSELHNAFRQSCSKEEVRHQSQEGSWCEEDNQDQGCSQKSPQRKLWPRNLRPLRCPERSQNLHPKRRSPREERRNEENQCKLDLHFIIL